LLVIVGCVRIARCLSAAYSSLLEHQVGLDGCLALGLGRVGLVGGLPAQELQPGFGEGVDGTRQFFELVPRPLLLVLEVEPPNLVHCAAQAQLLRVGGRALGLDLAEPKVLTQFYC